MKPMLSFHYKDHMASMPFPCYMQPKLDGIRLLYQNGVMQSRSHGKEEEVILGSERLKHLRIVLNEVNPDIGFDGELYIHNWSRQQINGAARVRSVDDGPSSSMLEYHVFDIFHTKHTDLPFSERLMWLDQLHFGRFRFSPVKVVETQYTTTHSQADANYREWKLQGYEGAMYKHPDAPYGFSERCTNKENRWKYTLKRKDWLDGEFECIGVEEGEGKYAGMVGALKLITPDGRQFNCGSGLTDADREYFWRTPPLGERVQIKYDIISDGGVPIQPRFVEVIE